MVIPTSMARPLGRFGRCVVSELHANEATGIPASRLLAIIAMQTQLARTAASVDDVMAVVVERAMALTAASGAIVEIVDGDAMVYRAACGAAAEFVGARIPRRGSLAGLCIEQGVALYAADTALDARVDRAACQRIGVAAMVCVPLRHQGAAVGVLKVMSGRAHAFEPATPATLALLVDVIAAALHHAKEYEAVVAMSLHDGLTGLLNRRAFDRQLGQEAARSVRHRHALSVAMFDLDGLKAANDTLGHAAGDAILRDAATILRSTLRDHDGCFRLGGDEFAALLPETAEGPARHAVARCCTNVLAAHLGGGKVGISAGVAQLQPSETMAELVARADAELYAHKRRNRHTRSGQIRPISRVLRTPRDR